MADPLADPARYFPLRTPRYEVGPGLHRWATDFGNGATDARVFQIDNEMPEFLDNMERCRNNDFPLYYGESSLSDEVSGAVQKFMCDTLCGEYPDLFSIRLHGEQASLACALTGQSIKLDAKGSASEPRYFSTFDALCSQVPEDIAVIVRDGDTDHVAAMHSCCPNRWAPQAKLGQAFSAVHAPVPGFRAANPHAGKLVATMIDNGPFVRFVWGISRGTQLNLHPAQPADDGDGNFCLRVERQTTHGLGDVDAALFTIRTYHYPIAELDPQQRDTLAQAISTMTREALRYKGIEGYRDELLNSLS